MVAFGSALFRFYAFRRGDEGETAGHIRALVRGAAFCALLSACGWLGLTAVDFGGDDLASFASTLWTILFATDFGPVWLVRLAAALALLVVAVLRPRPVVVLALATVVLGSEAWIGHSAIGGPLHRAVQVVHLLSAGAWLGGLAPLAYVLREGAEGHAAEDRACRVLVRFSAVGVVSVGLIAVTGMINTWLIVGRIPGFAATYDRLILLKIALFLAMVLVAAFNRFRLLPLLDAGGGSRRSVLAWFRRTVLLEQALGLAVVLAASLLGMTSPG